MFGCWLCFPVNCSTFLCPHQQQKLLVKNYLQGRFQAVCDSQPTQNGRKGIFLQRGIVLNRECVFQASIYQELSKLLRWENQPLGWPRGPNFRNRQCVSWQFPYLVELRFTVQHPYNNDHEEAGCRVFGTAGAIMWFPRWADIPVGHRSAARCCEQVARFRNP